MTTNHYHNNLLEKPPDEVVVKEFDTDIMNPNIRNYMLPNQGGSKIVVIGRPASGKCLAYGTPVLMYNGYTKEIQNIKVNDFVLNEKGYPVKVCSVTSGEEEMYRVNPKLFGESYVVNKSHILTLWHNKNKQLVNIPLSEFMLYTGNEQRQFSSVKAVVNQFCLNKHQQTKLSEPFRNHYSLGFYCTLQTLKIKLVKPQDFPDVFCDLSYYKKFFKHYNVEATWSIYCFADIETRIALAAGIFDCLIGMAENLYPFTYLHEKYQLVIKRKFFREKQMQFVWENTDMLYLESLMVILVEGILPSVGFVSTFKAASSSVEIAGDFKRLPCHNLGNLYNLCSVKDVLSSGIQKRNTISIEKVPDDERLKYYGFTLPKDSSGRFLLGDNTITHNTTLVSSLIYEKRHLIPSGVVFSGTEDSNSYWQQYFPKTFIYNDINTDKIQNFIHKQKLAIKYLPNPWSLLLLDDCSYNQSLFKTALMGNLFKNGRHWKMFFIMSIQYVRDLPPVLQNNIDFSFILREPSKRSRKVLFENYSGNIPTYPIFNALMDEVTQDFTALVINNTVDCKHWSETIYFYKAGPIPKMFKFGSTDFWAFHYARTKPMDQLDLSNLLGSYTQSQIDKNKNDDDDNKNKNDKNGNNKNVKTDDEDEDKVKFYRESDFEYTSSSSS
eukprot:Pgem_evm4s6026